MRGSQHQTGKKLFRIIQRPHPSCDAPRLRCFFGVHFSGIALEGVEGPFCRKAPICEGNPEKADGEWNETIIVCKGGHIRATVNGVLANEAVAAATEGYIGFQSEGGPIEFRNIYITR